jgi:ankyrin repeat protein
VEAHDLDALQALLARFPELVTARGTNGNDLLGMAAATRDERAVRLLLDHGANVAAANAHGWTALHQAAYLDLPQLAAMLLDAGAPVDVSARGEGGTPLVVALFWGNHTTAELLAQRAIVPDNLRTAAGLGRLDRLAAAPGAPRGFYRPHSGFPAWRPADDLKEALDEAVAWAARNDRLDAIDALSDRGAALDRDVYRGSPLIWAAACGRRAAVEHLVRRGVDPSSRSTFGGPGHGQDVTALHLAAHNGNLELVRALLELGADPEAEDGLFGGTPADWADHGGHAAVRDTIAAARRG